jgi:tetratricopeptide (TPR) repeat protein
MSRVFLSAAVAAVILAPSGLSAQKAPERTKELKDAERFVASSMVAPDPAEARARLERALNPLQQAQAKDPDNALVWFTSGQVYAGLNEIARADSAFDKAAVLYAPLAAEIEVERLRSWNSAFEAGLKSMDEQKYPEAIAYMENAELIYDVRPESKLNLAALYANQSEFAKAEAAYRSVAALVAAADLTKLQAEEATQWKRFGRMATLKIAEVAAARGVKAFEENRYDDAITAFREARELNPHARDYHYNLAQSLYAKARDAEDRRAEMKDQNSAAAKELAKELVSTYTEVEPIAMQTRAVDPNNEDLFQLLMRSYRVRGDLAADAATKAEYQKKVSDLLKDHASLGAVISDLNTSINGQEANVTGTLRNLKLAAGAPVKILVTLMSTDGSVAGEQEITVNAPAANADAKFEGVVKVNGDIAGWKYSLR